MDGGAGPLYGAAELERQDAQDETQQGDDQPYHAHQFEAKGVLEEETTTSPKAFNRSYKVIIYSLTLTGDKGGRERKAHLLTTTLCLVKK